MGAQSLGGGRRAGESDDVLLGEVIEQVADATADELQRALGQQSRRDDQFDQPLGEIGRL